MSESKYKGSSRSVPSEEYNLERIKTWTFFHMNATIKMFLTDLQFDGWLWGAEEWEKMK